MKSRLLQLCCVLAAAGLLFPRPAYAVGAIRVTVSPNVLLADGISTATVSAMVRTSSGRPVRDGTEVRFYTTAGTITQVAFTSAGVARATLTSSAIASSANISVSAGLDQAIVAVPMVSKLVEASVGGRVMRIEGKYVAYSEDKRFIQADEQVRIRYRGVTVEANSAQVDIDGGTLKALGRVNVASDDKTLVGERLWLDLKSFEGYIFAVGSRKWFSAYGLTELPEKPKNLNPDFDLVDLSDSRLLWVSKQASYVVDERVQLQGARAFVGGIKSIRMPFHEANLKVGFGESGQYVGIGSEGLTVDLPFYVHMTPGSTTAFRVGYGGARSGGIGYFTRQAGLSVDLVQKYGFAGASEGEASITNLSTPDRLGFYWGHTQQVTKSTRLVSNLQFPEHRDMYGQVNLTSGLPVGTLQLSLAAAKPQRGALAKTLSFAFETKPKPIADNLLSVSAETTFFRRDAQEVRVARGIRLPIQDTQYQTFGLKLRPRSAELGAGFSLDSSATLRAVSGGLQSGFGPALDTQIRRPLRNNGSLAFGFSYNHLATVNDLLPSSGKLNATLNLGYPVTSRLRVAALGNMSLDADSRSSLLQVNYQLTRHLRLDFLHTLFQFGGLGDFDYQLGIARAFGNRELGVYWSRREHRFLFEFGAARF